MKKLKLFLLFFLFSVGLSATSSNLHIVKIESLDQIPGSQPLHTLYFFDIDDTLVDSPSMLGSKAWRKYISTATQDETENWHDIFSLFVARKHPIETVEKITRQFVHDLQMNGYPVFGLTARERKMWYDTPMNDIDLLTINQLDTVEIHFDTEDLDPQLANSPEYFKGVFFADVEEKGEYLLKLFKRGSQLPEKVIFIDDKWNQVESVAAALEQIGVNYACYWYTATDEKARQFDPLIANIQLYHLWTTNGARVLSDSEAASIAQQYPDKNEGYYLQSLLNAAKIQSIDIREEGVVGKLFLPNATGPRPAIIVFSGSDGGFHERAAKLFAQEGYVALALAFFNADTLPQNLENIPLEYFFNGIQWLKAQSQVRSDKIYLYGPSKGGELVLLLASLFPDEIASAVAVVPSCVAFGGIPNEKVSCWSYKGKPIPFAPTPSKEDVYKQLEKRKTVNLVEIYLEKMQDQTAFQNALIEVENIKCPLLLISGQEDKMWPSWIYGDIIMKRLHEYDSKISRKHLCYEDVGHMITNPYDPIMTEAFLHPVTGLYYEIGGKSEAQAAACKESWLEILEFFKSSGD